MSEEDYTPEEIGYPQQEPGYPPPVQEVAVPVAATTSMTVEMLRQTKPWVRFLSILGFIGAGLMILCGLIMGVAGVAGGAPEMFLLFILYPVLGLLYIFPSLYLYRYASRIAEFILYGQSEHLDSALEAQKSYWRFMGIMMLVVLCLYALIFLIAIFAGIMSAL
jgi:hypothetical protein